MNTEMPKISQQQMLVEVEMSNGKPFLIKFIAAEDGRLCVIARAMYGGQKREAHQNLLWRNESTRHPSSKTAQNCRLPTWMRLKMMLSERLLYRTLFSSIIIV
jgi:hypothetical protein